jgi:FtsP/CotA-like multicopper oxidase with cupredoxin domain
MGLTLALVMAGCNAPAPAARPRAATLVPVVTLTLASDSQPAVLTLPPDAGQITLRLPGDLGDVDQLTAEISPADAPDEVKRWPVDGASGADDGATASVTVPAFAVPPGAYRLTVWQGDAAVVQRYAFQIRK